MSSESIKNILIISITWLLLYVLAVYSVYLSLKYGGSRYWATPVWMLLYFIPGYLAGYFIQQRWIIAGIFVGVLGSVFWLLHAQLSFTHVGALINIISNSLVSLFGAWLGQRRVHKQNAL